MNLLNIFQVGDIVRITAKEMARDLYPPSMAGEMIIAEFHNTTNNFASVLCDDGQWRVIARVTDIEKVNL